MQAETYDRQLVEAARDGDREAFTELLGRHRQLAGSLCLRMLRDSSLAEDAVQEAALQAWRGLAGLKSAERFGPWYAGIALNVCQGWIRVQTRERALLEQAGKLYVVREDDPLTRSAEIELSLTVQAAVAELPEGQRSAILLHYWSDLSYAETAAALGIETGAVRTRLHKGRENLRETLKLMYLEDTMTDKQEVQCSFCGKPRKDVWRMIAGPGGIHICNECVQLCNKIIADEERKSVAEPAPA